MTRRTVRAPHRSSLGYRRKRASSRKPRVRGWPAYDGTPKILGYPGFKAGMTRLLYREDREKSHLANQQRFAAVTVIETPPVILIGLRSYKTTPYGLKVVADVVSNGPSKFIRRRRRVPDDVDTPAQLTHMEETLDQATELRAVVLTQPHLTGIGTKTPEILELKIGANSANAAFDWAKEKIDQELLIEDFTKPGQYVDVIGITKGKGFNGVVKRHGVTKLQHKTKDGVRRVGSIASWKPARVKWLLARYGQMGYGRRTEYNKRVMVSSTDVNEINPAGGFVKYGLVRNRYLAVKGSVPGPKNRMVILRDAIRNKFLPESEPKITYVSTVSQQR